jgi:hypothetical protein
MGTIRYAISAEALAALQESGKLADKAAEARRAGNDELAFDHLIEANAMLAKAMLEASIIPDVTVTFADTRGA